MSSSALPRAILLDLDDTILDDSSTIDDCWREACDLYQHEYAPLTAEALRAAIKNSSRWFWGDAERHRTGRLELDLARAEVVRLALADLGIADSQLATKIAAIYADRRDAGMEPLPDALDAVKWLRRKGCRLALLTNGASDAQRRKISRFGLAELFDGIFVEGELGFGKPDERIYRVAMNALDITPSDAWMVGDNLEWDVAAPKKLGLFAVWVDRHGRGLPAGAPVTPDLTISALSELRTR